MADQTKGQRGLVRKSPSFIAEISRYLWCFGVDLAFVRWSEKGLLLFWLQVLWHGAKCS